MLVRAAKYLDEDDSVAMLEMQEKNEMEEEATPAISQSSIEVYENWKQDVEMTNSLLADNTTAAKIALWRYKNPTSDDKHLCAEEQILRKLYYGVNIVVAYEIAAYLLLRTATIKNTRKLHYGCRTLCTKP